MPSPADARAGLVGGAPVGGVPMAGHHQQHGLHRGPAVGAAVHSEAKELPPIKLASTRDERTKVDQLSNLFAIFTTVEALESAYVGGHAKGKAYESPCKELISQYKVLREAMKDLVPSVEKFVGDYKLGCEAAVPRLFVGMPATMQHGGNDQDDSSIMSVFYATQHFITAMDAVKLEYKAVDQLHPALTDVVDSLSKVPGLPSEHTCVVKVREWLVKVNQLAAHEELTDDQLRQLVFDLETSYNAFHKFLEDKKKKKGAA